MRTGLMLAVLLFGTVASFAEPATPSPLEQQGRALAEWDGPAVLPPLQQAKLARGTEDKGARHV